MTRSANDLTSLTIAVDEALQLLEGYSHDQCRAPSGDSLPSLVEQCETLLAELDAQPSETMRSIHHFACTGGTLISRCVAAMPNTVLLSEIDPLSSHYKTVGPKKFAPTDLTQHVRSSLRPAGKDTIVKMFLASLDTLKTELSHEGLRLVLRDHSHSQYCTKDDANDRPTLRALLTRRFDVRSCVTVRHPLDSYLSLHANKWSHFSPFTLEEYSRRYMMFLNDYRGVEVVRYEEVLSSPEAAIGQICQLLDVPFVKDALNILDVVALSGDSGRSDSVIGARPRRPIPEGIADEAVTSATYRALCERLDYRADPRG